MNVLLARWTTLSPPQKLKQMAFSVYFSQLLKVWRSHLFIWIIGNTDWNTRHCVQNRSVVVWPGWLLRLGLYNYPYPVRSLQPRKYSCLVSSFVVAAFQLWVGGILLENTPHLTVWGWEHTLLVWSPPLLYTSCPLNAKHPPKPSTHSPSP